MGVEGVSLGRVRGIELSFPVKMNQSSMTCPLPMTKYQSPERPNNIRYLEEGGKVA